MAAENDLPTGRKQAVGVVVSGTLALGLLALSVSAFVASAAHLGLIGHPQRTRSQVCFFVPAVKAYRGTPSHYDCTAYLAHGTAKITYPSCPGQRVEVAKEPWGGWVPVERKIWIRICWTFMPLVPLAGAVLFGRSAALSASLYRRYRGWRNSSLLPTGSSE